MQLIKSFLPIVLIIFVFGCSSGITRYGYDLNNLQIQTSSCKDIPIKNNATFPADSFEILGKIKASDTGFSIKCSEEYVLHIFKDEACALEADVINITEEKYPSSFGSSCYRAKAEFIRLKDRDRVNEIESDSKYSPELIAKRSKEMIENIHKRAIEAGVAGGTIGGMMSTGGK